MPRFVSGFAAVVVTVVTLAGLGCTARKEQGAAPPPDLAPPGATLLEGLGAHHRAITTKSPEAQRWFDQGLILAYGFNHDAAERSFLKAIELDAQCAMCWWGAALVLGPHVNWPMEAPNNPKAWMRIRKAVALAPAAQSWEQAFITALAARYAENPPEDRKPLDEAYAKAMRALVAKLSDDLDAATLYAEALMDLQPWNYYDAKGREKGHTREIVATLESVMKRNPDHPGALHLYIHAVEASNDPDRGALAADRLRELVPGAGHLVHMPAHIYTRVGRYHDAVIANEKAIASDAVYLSTCTPRTPVYPLAYVPHNFHFLWWASSMEGAAARALAAADEAAKRTNDPELLATPGMEFLQDFQSTPVKAKLQFGRWDEVLATPKPPEAQRYAVALWHFAQGVAHARRGEPALAEPHLPPLTAAAADPVFATYLLSLNPEHSLARTLKVAERVLAGELAAARKNYAAAIAALQQAVGEEDANAYFEPPLWHDPARLALGRVLLAAGRPAQAEKVFREDLRHNRENGWALHGLALSLKAQGKPADDVMARLRKAWAHADVALTAAAR